MKDEQCYWLSIHFCLEKDLILSNFGQFHSFIVIPIILILVHIIAIGESVGALCLPSVIWGVRRDPIVANDSGAF